MLLLQPKLRSPGSTFLKLLWMVIVSLSLLPLSTSRAQEVEPLRIIPITLNADTPYGRGPSIAYSPNGRLIAAGWDGGICVFKASNGAPIKRILVREEIFRIGFSPDSKMVYGKVWTSSEQSKQQGFPIGFWKISSGKMVKTIQLKDESHFAIHPEGDLYAVAHENKVGTFKFKTEKLLNEYLLTEKQDWATGLAFRPDGKALAVSTNLGIQLLDTATMTPIHEAQGRAIANSNILKYSTNGLLASLLTQYKLAVTKIEDSKNEIKIMREELAEVIFWAQAISPNGNLVALGGGKNKRANEPAFPYLELIDTTTGELVAQLKDMVPDDVYDIAFSPDGKQLAVTCESELAIRVFDTSKFVANKKQSKAKPIEKPEPPKSDPIDGPLAARTWTSTNGQFKVKAVLVEQSEDSVRLKKANGKVITVDKERLCPADNKYLKQH